jgi:hypothetical protein
MDYAQSYGYTGMHRCGQACTIIHIYSYGLGMDRHARSYRYTGMDYAQVWVWVWVWVGVWVWVWACPAKTYNCDFVTSAQPVGWRL